MVQPNIRIDPREIQAKVGRGKFQTAVPSFGESLADAAGAMAPAAAEATAQTTGNVSAASVLSAAFTALPGSYAAGSGGYYGGGAGGMDELGLMGASRFAGGTQSPLGSGIPGSDPSGLGVSQASLIDKMNSNNLQLLGLQATLQNNMQSWTTKSNVLKSSYEAKMNMIQKFSVRG